jgi:hypothetical protein
MISHSLQEPALLRWSALPWISQWSLTYGIERRANDCAVEWFDVLAFGSQTMYVGQVCVCHQPCELAGGDVRIIRSLENNLLR